MKKQILIIGVLTALLFAGCADVSPHVQECVTGDPYGFWSGLWHGIISPFSFIGSLFSDNIAVYAYDNTGGWYDFGFLWGIGALSGTATYSSKK